MNHRAWSAARRVAALALLGASILSCDKLQAQFEAEWEEGRRRRESSTSADAMTEPPAGATAALTLQPSATPSSSAPSDSTSPTATTTRGGPGDLSWVPEKLRGPNGKPGRILALLVILKGPESKPTQVVAVLGESAERLFRVQLTTFVDGKLDRRQPFPGFEHPTLADGLQAVFWDERDLDFAAVVRMTGETRRNASLPTGAALVVTCMRDLGRSCALKCTVANDERQALAAFDGRGQPWTQPLVPRADCPAMDLPSLLP